jgi:hypothetical protein
LCEEIATKYFQVHLDRIKASFCIDKKFKGEVVIHMILDSRQLDVQAFHFKLTISRHVDAMMREAFDVNLVT